MIDPSPARPPTAEEQLVFLRSLRRLLDEGSFVASYKYALLHAIADLCVVDGNDSGAALELSTRRIAEQFVRLYWRQVAPFIASGEADVLRQNTGRQAAVVRELAERHERYEGVLGRLEADRAAWEALLRTVERTVKVMPLWKLQTVGSERLDFLYPNLERGDSWSRYPLDLGHNLVLAHDACNAKKSNLLAAEEHLGRWAERNHSLGDDLSDAFEERGILHDLGATNRVVEWAYGQVESAGGQVWVMGSELRELGPGWRAVF